MILTGGCDMRHFGSCQGPARVLITWATDIDHLLTERFCDAHGMDLLLMIQEIPGFVLAYRAETLIH